MSHKNPAESSFRHRQRNGIKQPSKSKNPDQVTTAKGSRRKRRRRARRAEE